MITINIAKAIIIINIVIVITIIVIIFMHNSNHINKFISHFNSLAKSDYKEIKIINFA